MGHCKQARPIALHWICAANSVGHVEGIWWTGLFDQAKKQVGSPLGDARAREGNWLQRAVTRIAECEPT